MKKIKDELIKKIYKADLSQDELLFLIYINQVNNNNSVANIHYKDVSSILYCSISHFYNIISSLEFKGFIKISKCSECKQEITVVVLNNNFNTKSKFKNYLDLNSKIFDIELLNKLKAGSIRCLLYFIFRINKQRSRVSKDDFNELIYRDTKSICKELNITERMLKVYIKELIKEKILNVSIKKDKNNKSFKLIKIDRFLFLKPLIEIAEKSKIVSREENSAHRYYLNIIKNYCRRKKLKYNDFNLHNTAILMNQYYQIATDRKKDILTIIRNVFNNLKEELNSISVHTIIKHLLNTTTDDKLIVY